MTIDDDMFVVEADFVVIDAIGGIVFQEMRKNFRGAEAIECDDFGVTALESDLERAASNSPKTVYR